jgi:hypothetical protein
MPFPEQSADSANFHYTSRSILPINRTVLEASLGPGGRAAGMRIPEKGYVRPGESLEDHGGGHVRLKRSRKYLNFTELRSHGPISYRHSES